MKKMKEMGMILKMGIKRHMEDEKDEEENEETEEKRKRVR